MHQFIKGIVVFYHIGILGAVHSYLIGKSPHADGRMVIALGDKLFHLVMGVDIGLGHMAGNIGNFRPYDHTTLIAEVIEILIVLIMGKADGGGAHFADKLHILLMMLGKESISDFPAVLMAAHTAQRILPSVKDKASLRVDFKASAAEAGTDIVKHCPAAEHKSLG